MITTIADLCQRYGVALSYRSISGDLVNAPEETRRAMLMALGADLTDVAPGTGSPPTDRDDSIRDMPHEASAQCFVPEFLRPGKCWGVALQLYQVSSERSLGIGDFRDLGDLAVIASTQGADFLGLNPLHALFTAAPNHCSPFSPSNRRFLNPLYIAVEDAPGYEPGDVSDSERDDLQQQTLVDYERVAMVKLRALRTAFLRWLGMGAPGLASCDIFVDERGQALADHAAFETISGHFVANGGGAGWHTWPDAYQDPTSAEVRQILSDRHEDYSFHLYLQWVADRQLRAAAERARSAGMRIGLYLDLAVAEAPDGSASWSDRTLVLPGVRVGAPPDFFNTAGQDWGLAPFSPTALSNRRYQPFRDMLNDVLRHAGALRLDHVMGLLRLYLIPRDHTATQGAYVRYGIRQALDVLSEVSHERGAVIIGEDLGTVPAGFRELMADAEVQSYRIFYFERQGERLASPYAYPERAISCLSTHDMIPLDGWLLGHDIDLRVQYGFNNQDAAGEQRQQRLTDIHQLHEEMAAIGLANPTAHPPSGPDDTMAMALHGYLATAPTRLFAVRLEDLAGETEPVNLPSTSDTYPNWRRRFRQPLEELMNNPRARGIMTAIAMARPRP